MVAMDGTHAASVREERNLGDYIVVCWRYRVVTLGALIVAGAITFGLSATSPRTFESTVTFSASNSKLGDFSQPMTSPAAFRPMVESLTTAAAVIRDLGLDQPPHNMTPSAFLDRVMAVSEVRGTSLLIVTVNGTDPVLTSTIANRIADHAVQTARRVSASEASHARDLIKDQLDLAQQQLDAAEAALMAYRQRTRVEALRRDAEARLGGPQLPAFSPRTQQRAQANAMQLSVAISEPGPSRDGLLEVTVKVASQRARLESAERDLTNRPPGDPARPALEASLASMRAELASLEVYRSALTSGHTLDADTMKALSQLYEVESDLARHQLERDVAERGYTDLSQRYREARLQVIGRSADFVIIDPAVPADRPVSRHVARNTILAMLIAFFFAVAGVLTWDSVRRQVSLS